MYNNILIDDEFLKKGHMNNYKFKKILNYVKREGGQFNEYFMENETEWTKSLTSLFLTKSVS